MLPMSAMPYGQMPPPVLTAVTQGVSSETRLGSIPGGVVYSAIALPELQNQRGGGAAYTAMPQMAASTPSVTQAMQQLANLSSAGGSADFSVAFFAQLLGQSSSDMQSQLTSVFRDVVPLRAGDPKLFEVYSEIKYMPSAAAKPSPAPKMPPVEIKLERGNEVFAAMRPQSPQNFNAAAVVMKSAFNYMPASGVITYFPSAKPAQSQSQRLLAQKSPIEAYQQATTRKVEAAEDKMDAAV